MREVIILCDVAIKSDKTQQCKSSVALNGIKVLMLGLSIVNKDTEFSVGGPLGVQRWTPRSNH